MSDTVLLIDAEEEKKARRERMMGVLKWALPLGLLMLSVVGWHYIVVANQIPHYILPSPGRVFETLFADWHILGPALWNTLTLTIMGLIVAVIGGVGLAILFTQSRIIEYSLFPYAVILQVTPIVAIFPLINIYIDDITTKLLLCAWIVAFFPLLSNTTLGLNSTDHNLRNLFQLYGASRWQTLVHLQLPNALPYFLTGLRIAGGLALIGSVVAEFVAGTAGSGSGLATRIIESGFRLNISRLFACLLLISLSGIAIYLVTSLISHFALHKWHESALKREN
ncbi:MAG: ABC transporter permease [Pseudomonadota bacterium]